MVKKEQYEFIKVSLIVGWEQKILITTIIHPKEHFIFWLSVIGGDDMLVDGQLANILPFMLSEQPTTMGLSPLPAGDVEGDDANVSTEANGASLTLRVCWTAESSVFHLF